MSKEQTSLIDVADALRDRITKGDFGKYGRLPPVADLSHQFGVSRDTVNRALQLLQAEGYLESRGENKRGLVINRSRIRLQGITARFDFELQKQGLIPFEANIDEPTIIPASEQVAQYLNITIETPVVRRFRKQGVKQEGTVLPYRLAENFYPTTLVDEVMIDKMRKDNCFDVIVAIKEKYNKMPVRIHEDVIGRLPRSQEGARPSQYHASNPCIGSS